MANLPQQIARNQYTADGVTTTYAYTFEILSANSIANDIAVYVTPSGQQPNPVTDIQTLSTAYVVTGVGNVNGGTIVFQGGHIPPLSSIVTIVRNMSISIDTDFAVAQNFNGANLDAAFDRVVLILQQVYTMQAFNSLSYIINALLPPSGGTNIVPPLPDNYTWVGQGGKVIAANIETNPDLSTLRSQLASEASGGSAGASLIGYYDSVNLVPQTVNTFLNNLPTWLTPQLSVVPTGTVLDYAGTAAPTGYLVCNGSAVSRTTYAALFAAIGTTWGNGDGSTTFNLPSLARSVTVGAGGSGSGTLGNAVGDTGGAETHTMTVSEMPAHAHPGSNAFVNTGIAGSGAISVFEPNDSSQGSAALPIASQGSGTAFNIIQPSAVMNKIIKI